MENSSQHRVNKRRVWTTEEENALIECMEEACVRRQKTEGGGFKPGVVKEFERKLLAKFPNTDLKAKPHIESAMKRLRILHAAYADMLRQSGFGWDPIKHCIDVENSVWEEYVKSHDKVKDLRNKSFPWFERLDAIFGRDRATGQSAQTPVEIEEEVEQEIDQETANDANIECEEVDGICHTSGTQSAHTPSFGPNTRKRQRTKSEGVSAAIDRFTEQFKESMEHSNECLRELFTSDRQLQDRKNAAAELENMDLSEDDLFNAQFIILQNTDQVQVLLGLPAHRRKTYVLRLLSRES